MGVFLTGCGTVKAHPYHVWSGRGEVRRSVLENTPTVGETSMVGTVHAVFKFYEELLCGQSASGSKRSNYRFTYPSSLH